MGAPARSWDHPRWRYEDEPSPAARRSAARAASRSREYERPRHEAVVEPRTQPALRVVQRHRLRVGSILLLIAFLGAALAAPVAVNLAVVRTQWQIAELRQQQDDVVAARSSLRAEHAALSSAQRVKATADRLGMVLPTAVGFIHLGSSSQRSDAAGESGAVRGDTRDVPSLAGGDGTILASASAEAGAGR